MRRGFLYRFCGFCLSFAGMKTLMWFRNDLRLADNPAPVKGAWVMDFVNHGWMAADSAIYLRSDTLQTPMASGLAALTPGTESDSIRSARGGELVSWAWVTEHPPTHDHAGQS